MAITKAKLSYVDGITSSTAELNLLSGLSGVVEATANDGSSIIPSGTTAQRDVSPAAGYLRFNTSDSSFEGYDGSAWGAIGGGGINNQKLDDISSGFNSSDTSFSLAVSSVAVEPGSVNNVLISLNGVIQEPTTTYTISGSTITFTTAPDSGDTFFGLYYGSLSINVPADGSVGTDQLSSANIAFDTSTLFIDSTNDRVGVGTITPGRTLHVNGGTSDTVLRLESSDANVFMQFADGNTTYEPHIGAKTNDLVFLKGASGFGEAMRIDSSGDVGIGTTSPNLHGWTRAVTLNTSSNAGYELGQSNVKYGAFALQGDGRVQLTNFTANPLTFQTNNTEAMRIDSSGNVGIGETSPDAKLEIANGSTAMPGLHIKGSNGSATANKGIGVGPWILLDNTASGTSTGYPKTAGIVYQASNADNGYTTNSGQDYAYIMFNRTNSPNNNSTQIEFGTQLTNGAADTKMLIDPNGNVGIGTSSPAHKLHVASAAGNGNDAFIGILTGGSGATSANHDLGVYFGSTSNYIYSSYDGSGNARNELLFVTGGAGYLKIQGADIGIGQTGSFGGTGHGGASFRMDTGRNGAAFFKTTHYDCLWVEQGLAAGGTAATFVRNGGGDILRINTTSQGVGSITTNGSTTSFNTSSDYRLKENIVDLSRADAVARLKQIPVRRFNFINTPDITVDGFVAHEVSDIVPEAVNGVKDGMREEEYEVTPAVLDDKGNVVTKAVMGTREVPAYQGIDQAKLVPLLTAALQEAIAEIENLKTRIEALEG